ncbi:MAG: oxidoreductase, partial [Alphaproteobacteria bacterium]
MSGSVVLNRLRRAFYLDSVALMRLSQAVAALPGVEEAALMIGTPSNREIMAEAGLLADEGRAAAANDLVIALRATGREAGEAALAEAEALLDAPAAEGRRGDGWRPKTLEAAVESLAGADLAIVSVPGAFAAAEARKALAAGLNVMIFSDNVPLEEECALKREARERGLLLMGPDCGTALIGGVPLAFANEVPRGPVGIVAASGTGLQEVSSLIARGGGGVSHGIGVGGRDLGEAVGGVMTLAAIDALDADPATERIVLVSKPPAEAVARRVLERVGASSKPFTVCFVGADDIGLPANARLAPTLTAAAEDALGGAAIETGVAARAAAGRAAAALAPTRRAIHGLYAGGTLCAEAQTVLIAAGEALRSNAPVPGAQALGEGGSAAHCLVDLGADAYTLGRPHPMIDPAVRSRA